MASSKDKVKACSREQAINVISAYIGERCAYHNHKENMAHVAAALYFSAFGTVLVAEKWPVHWVYGERGIGAIVVAFILALAYVKWQLKNRRETAVLVAAAIELRFCWMTKEPTEQDLKLPIPRIRTVKVSWRQVLCFIVGHLCPNRKEIKPLLRSEHLPRALRRLVPSHQRSGAICHERILVLAMWALFFATLFRFLCTPFSSQMIAVWALSTWFSFLGTAVSA